MSLEASFAAVQQELKGMRSWMESVSGRQSGDHDDVIRMQGQISRLEGDVAGLRDDVRDGLAAVREDFRLYKEAQENKEEAEEKEGRSRNWTLILAIVGPFISAILAAVAAAYMVAQGG